MKWDLNDIYKNNNKTLSKPDEFEIHYKEGILSQEETKEDEINWTKTSIIKNNNKYVINNLKDNQNYTFKMKGRNKKMTLLRNNKLLWSPFSNIITTNCHQIHIFKYFSSLYIP